MNTFSTYIYIFFLFPILASTQFWNHFGGSLNEFRCLNGEIIDYLNRCDGSWDCSDGSDEENCGVGRAKERFKCLNGEYVYYSDRCDGELNCHDGSDEKNCEDPYCGYGNFKCEDGPCIAQRERCDGFDDCPDGTDEANCPVFLCDSNQFQCKNPKKCVSLERYCDGRSDCGDDSDESECTREGCDFKRPIGTFNNGILVVTLTNSSEHKVEIVRTNRLEMAACHGNKVVLPTENTPSCHSNYSSQCGWKTFDGIKSVMERPELVGSHYKIVSDSATLISDVLNDLTYSFCILLELLSSEPNLKPSHVELFILTNDKAVLLKNNTLQKESTWHTEKIVADIPDGFIPTEDYQLMLKIRNAKGLYLNKIYGCNPYINEVRALVGHYKRPSQWSRQSISTLSRMNENYDDSSCSNGGELDRITGKCSCPPGFWGDLCETACGSNKWGTNCEHECSGRSGDCEGVKFCTLDLKKCECASGFTSNKCDMICKAFTYGSSCKQNCGHCRDNSTCNIITGHCSNGCLDGYKPPFCKKRFIYTDSTPEVRNVNFKEATIEYNYKEIKGDGKPALFQVYYKDASQEVWEKSKVMKIGKDNISFTLKNLKGGVKYEAKVVVRDEQGNGYENVPAVNFTTNCTMSHNFTIMRPIMDVFRKGYVMLKWSDQTMDQSKCNPVEKQIELFTGFKNLYYKTYDDYMELNSLQAGTKYRVRVRAIGKTNGIISRPLTFITLPDEFAAVSNLKATNIGAKNVHVEWTPGNKDTNSTFQITVTCLEILSSFTITPCPKPIIKLDIQQNQILIGGLKANTFYELAVRELLSPKVVQTRFITLEAEPEVEPKTNNVTVTNSTAQIVLLPPTDCYDCNGDLIGYFYEVFGPDNNIVESNKTMFSNISINGLKPLTAYRIRIYHYNSVGYNKKSYLEVKFTTLSSVPDAVQDLVIYKKGRDMLGLRWSPPENADRNLLEFKLEDGTRSFVEQLKPCPSWPQQFCYTITNLRPDTSYNLSVSSRISKSSDYGSPQYVVGVTREEAPEMVINLKVVAISEESVTVEWEPPRFHNGIIRSYLVKVEQTDSYDKKDCCKKYPLREILISEEKDKHQVQINDLKPASTYALSVMAETVWLGPSLRVTFNTRPSSSMGKIYPPSVVTNSSLIVWQKKNYSETPNTDYSQLVAGHLLLVLTDDSEDPEETTLFEQEITNMTSISPIQLLKEIYDNKFYIAAEYNEGDEVVLGDGTEREGEFGNVTNLRLKRGKTYTLVAAQVLSYCELFNVAVLISEPFLI